GVDVLLYRATSPGTRLVDYEAPSSLNEADLDLDSLQAFYLCQEATDQAVLSQSVAFDAINRATQAQNDVVAAVAAAQNADTNAADASLAAQQALQVAQDALDAVAPTTAADVPYDNTASGIAADDIQAAIDIIAAATGVIEVNSSGVANQSTVTGSTVTAALNTLLAAVNGKAPASHTHTAAQITDLAGLLSGKQDADPDTAKTDVVQAWSKPQRSVPTALVSGATITPDVSAAQDFSLNLGVSATLANPTGIASAVGLKGSIAGTTTAAGLTLAYGSFWFPIGAATAPAIPTTSGTKFRIDFHIVSTTRIDFALSSVGA
ncbi:MAG: Phage tail fiber protein, partial [Devosia sp.]|nr:Phage tail fiber protein [Devosia sp.]